MSLEWLSLERTQSPSPSALPNKVYESICSTGASRTAPASECAPASASLRSVHSDRDQAGDAEILFARFREEDVRAGSLLSKGVALKNLVKSKRQGINRGTSHGALSPKKSE